MQSSLFPRSHPPHLYINIVQVYSIFKFVIFHYETFSKSIPQHIHTFLLFLQIIFVSKIFIRKTLSRFKKKKKEKKHCISNSVKIKIKPVIKQEATVQRFHRCPRIIILGPRLMLFSRTGHASTFRMRECKQKVYPDTTSRALCFLSNNLIRRGVVVVDWPASVYRTYVSASGVLRI